MKEQAIARVGIVTYHTAVNYGAVLQAYALNRTVNGMGYVCETIDYQSPAINTQYAPRSRRACSSWKNFGAHNLTCLVQRKKKRNFKGFLTRIPRSTSCTRENAAEVAANYDVVITGSDQVFNPICHRNDPGYYLDFVKGAKKVAYAASLGSVAQFESSTLDTTALLSDFAALSFRESDATAYMSQKLGRECTTVLDPVWLLSGQEWESIAVHKSRKPYIFVYNLMDYPYMRQYVKKLQKQTGLDVLAVHRTVMGDFAYRFAKRCSCCSPEEFLGYIQNAAYVVTDSFHGTSLSILLKKRICVALNPAKDNTNSRLHTVLELTQLADRVIDPTALTCPLEEIDYVAVQERVRTQLQHSKAYLRSILETQKE